MAAAPNGEQESRLGFSIGRDHVSFDVDESVYSLEALYGACYLFIEKCFVYLSRSKPGVVDVRLTSRGSATSAELDTLAGEFANELLAQSTRLRLAQATARIREYYTAAALRIAASTSTPSIDELLAELESEDLGEDPLEIMVPWEEKHGAKPDGAAPKKDPEASDG